MLQSFLSTRWDTRVMRCSGQCPLPITKPPSPSPGLYNNGGFCRLCSFCALQPLCVCQSSLHQDVTVHHQYYGVLQCSRYPQASMPQLVRFVLAQHVRTTSQHLWRKPWLCAQYHRAIFWCFMHFSATRGDVLRIRWQ